MDHLKPRNRVVRLSELPKFTRREYGAARTIDLTVKPAPAVAPRRQTELFATSSKGRTFFPNNHERSPRAQSSSEAEKYYQPTIKHPREKIPPSRTETSRLNAQNFFPINPTIRDPNIQPRPQPQAPHTFRNTTPDIISERRRVTSPIQPCKDHCKHLEDQLTMMKKLVDQLSSCLTLFQERDQIRQVSPSRSPEPLDISVATQEYLMRNNILD